mmetsp:Transcript_11969/g.16579  ORF Transcript_11969/g.16579 Transcript_11969/m.16579 type:complete len:430 (-) Transcript_11969:801-2090(-)|eukprot:CAMPEP_0168546376 /NCGR_PEP_ID=MMETSP0413-20121227/3466_1 /TAXON_ID=136452 /ORGANISM="Filamoeba nolandi, Strain NC-AS-23-1" /LENGTH=429 /DNA_ID=CAMNT_0008576551 /DNA_START=46 /DNA_END=1335 /DNA_ORIENTATION=+
MDNLARRKWNSFPTVFVPSFVTLKDSKQQNYIAFQIVIIDGLEEWKLLKRYSQFEELRHQLRLQFPTEKIPILPPKKTIFDFGVDDTKFIENRRVGLEYFLQYLLAEPLFLQSQQVRAFLEPESLPNKLRRQKDNESFLIPPPTPNMRAPHVISLVKSDATVTNNRPSFGQRRQNSSSTFDSEYEEFPSPEQELVDFKNAKGPSLSPTETECYLFPLLNSINDNLATISALREEVSEIDNSREKMECVEDKRNKLDSSLLALQKERDLIKTLQDLDEVSANKELTHYLKLVLDHINRGLDWFSSFEDELFEALTANQTQNQYSQSYHSSLEARIKRLEDQAEALVVESVSLGNSNNTSWSLSEEEKERLEAKLISLQSTIRQEINRLNKTSDIPNDHVFINRLKNILAYLNKNFTENEKSSLFGFKLAL